jgi:predicted nucleotidyltransferase
LNITAIVAEYNPLHLGHKYHITNAIKETNADGLIAVISGNFVQRGMPAIIDKWERTKMALENGIDLVIELPTLYALSSAEFFSFGAISLLDSLGIVNNLSFGSECGNVDYLLKIAEVLVNEPLEYKEILKNFLDQGLSYPVARSKALQCYLLTYSKDFITKDLTHILNSSNNILGIEYCKSLLSLNSSIKPYTLIREGSTYNSLALDSCYSSATSIRKHMKENIAFDALTNHVPSLIFDRLSKLKNNNYNFVYEDSIMPFIKHKHFTSKNTLELLPDASEGLHNKISKGLMDSESFHELISFAKSKRYTYSRISRILCQYFIGFDNYQTKILRKAPCPYARILGLNKTGASMLKLAKKTSTIPLLTKLPRSLNEVLELDIQSTKAYSMINKNVNPQDDYLISPYILT